MLGFIPKRTKRKLKQWTGVLPDFLIIGTMKGGTTSLYNYMIQHPYVLPAVKKEVHFFDWDFQKGLQHYRSQFPTSLYKKTLQFFYKHALICGEASPYYFFHPHVARRVAQTIPNVKLIAILRNPVDRAYSHYWYWKKANIEHLSFEDALKAEPERLMGELEKMLNDETYDSFNYGYYSYLARGRYIEQLEHWESYFSKEQILVLCSEELYTAPSKTLQRVADFLSLPYWNLQNYSPHNTGKYSKMASETREYLISYFAPFNKRLYDHVNHDFDWDK
jgi:hypothetical protein